MAFPQYTRIKVEVAESGVARVILNDPDKRNKLGMQMLGELADVFSEIERDDTIKAVLLSGEGKVFCSGADLEWVASLKGKKNGECLPEVQKIMQAFEAAYNCGKPRIAAVQGRPAGGGVALAALCDYVVAEENTKFQISEKHLGLLPLAMYPYLIPRTGVDNAITASSREAALNAGEALYCGLVNEITDSSRLQNRAMEVAVRAAQQGRYWKPPAKGKLNRDHMEVDVDAARHLRMIDGQVANNTPEGRARMADYINKELAKILSRDEVQQRVARTLERIHHQR